MKESRDYQILSKVSRNQTEKHIMLIDILLKNMTPFIKTV